MFKLVKFRPLANENDLNRAKEIIETGRFWCSKLWNLNDPMEGVFSTYNPEYINPLFTEKNKRVICSFSCLDALNNPLLWGYYANGYKGIAIEIEVHNNMADNEKIKKITYKNESLLDSNVFGVDDIITRKLTNWEHENEYRFLKKSKEEGLYKIGDITKVHFGTPYKKMANNENIHNNSETLRKYNFLKKELQLSCKNKTEIVDFDFKNIPLENI